MAACGAKEEVSWCRCFLRFFFSRILQPTGPILTVKTYKFAKMSDRVVVTSTKRAEIRTRQPISCPLIQSTRRKTRRLEAAMSNALRALPGCDARTLGVRTRVASTRVSASPVTTRRVRASARAH